MRLFHCGLRPVLQAKRHLLYGRFGRKEPLTDHMATTIAHHAHRRVIVDLRRQSERFPKKERYRYIAGPS